MDAIVAKYNSFKSKHHLEFEVRFPDMGRPEFDQFTKNFINDPKYANNEIETTISILDKSALRGAWRNINVATFNGKIKVSSKTVAKKPVCASAKHKFGKYECNVALSEESDNGGTISDMTNALVRYKSRVSFKLSDHWRLDATLVYQSTVSEVSKLNNAIKDERCVVRKYSQLREICRYVNQHAIELEYTGESGTLTIQGVLEAVAILSKISGVDIGGSGADTSNIAKYGDVLRQVCDWNKARGLLKRALPSVSGMTRNDYYRILYPMKDWYVTDKADGVRSLALCYTCGGFVILSDIGVREITPPTGNISNVYDCEYMEANDRAYVFDILMHDGQPVVSLPFSKRLEKLEKLANDRLICKKYVHLDGTTDGIRNGVMEIMEYSDSMDYENDGLIFTCGNDNYHNGRVYKWKPRSKCTIDFLVLSPGVECLYPKRDGYVIYYLFVGIDEGYRRQMGIRQLDGYNRIVPEGLFSRNDRYKPIQFCPSFNPKAYVYYHKVREEIGDLHGRIVEMGWAERGDCGEPCTAMPNDLPGCEWQFHRIRDDRVAGNGMYGNDYKVAENVYTMYLDHFTVESLWLDNRGYFMHTVNKSYKAYNKFTRELYFDIIGRHAANGCNGTTVIDMCAGRGADISRFRKLGVERLLCMEKDTLALAELIRRKAIYNKNISGGNCAIYTCQADMSTSPILLVDKAMSYRFEPGTVDCITCNMAFHYLCDSVKHIENVMSFVKQMLVPGGVFVFSSMNGNEIASVLDSAKSPGELNKISIRDGDVIKYDIEKDYVGNAMPVGSRISVMVPFSEKRSVEPLVNMDYIEKKICVKYGFKLVAKYKTGDVISDYESGINDSVGENVANMMADLSEADREYSKYHMICVLVRDATKSGSGRNRRY